MGMEILYSTVSILAMTATVKSCTLSESGPSPYLIRISESRTDPVTYGHGSLIRQDKVLSTCTPFKRLNKEFKKTTWRLTGYNFEKQCKQHREPREIVMHESCNNADTITHDLAIWIVDPFKMVGMPFLWGNGKPQPPPLTIVKAIVDSLLKFQTASLAICLFRDVNTDGPELQNGTRADFINWFVCLDMLKNVTSLTADITRGLSSNTSAIQGFYDYFCGYDVGIKLDDSRSMSNLVNADWYSGAALMYEFASGMKIPVGLLSRGVNIRPMNQNAMNFHIVTAFHERVYEFLSKNGIEPSALGSEFRAQLPAAMNWRRVVSSGQNLRKSSNQNNHQSRLSSRGLWIHLTLLCCVMLAGNRT